MSYVDKEPKEIYVHLLDLTFNAYLRWNIRERPDREDDLDAQSPSLELVQIPQMVWSNKLHPWWAMVHVSYGYPQRLLDTIILNLLAGKRDDLQGKLTGYALGTDLMHFTACRHHSHGQLVDDKNTPFNGSGFSDTDLLAGRSLVADHLIHNF